jgi:cysteine desulfurase
MRLSEKGFDTSSGSACTSGNLDPSHVLIACGLETKVALGSLRVTLGKSTTKEDLELFVVALKEEVTKLAKIAGVVDIACR